MPKTLKPEANPVWHVDPQGNFHWGSAAQMAEHKAELAGRQAAIHAEAQGRKSLETRLREADAQPARQPRENGQDRER